MCQSRLNIGEEIKQRLDEVWQGSGPNTAFEWKDAISAFSV